MDENQKECPSWDKYETFWPQHPVTLTLHVGSNGETARVGGRMLQEMISDFLPQCPVTEGAVGSSDTPEQSKGCNGPAGPGEPIVVTDVMRAAGRRVFGYNNSELDYDAIYRAMAAVDPTLKPLYKTRKLEADRDAWREKCERLGAERAVLLAGVDELRQRLESQKFENDMLLSGLHEMRLRFAAFTKPVVPDDRPQGGNAALLRAVKARTEMRRT